MEESTIDDPGLDDYIIKSLEPPGFDHVVNKDLKTNFDLADIIRSSVDVFEEYGFEANEGITSSFLDGSWDTAEKITPRWGGFNIPVCYMEEDFYDSAKVFMNSLMPKEIPVNSPVHMGDT